MIQNLIAYVMFIYLSFIKEDMSLYTKFGKTFIKIVSFVHNIIIWTTSICLSPILFPLFVIGMKIVDNNKKIK